MRFIDADALKWKVIDGGTDYDFVDVLQDIADAPTIEHNRVDETADYENTLYNLTLYLSYIKNYFPVVWECLMVHFDGMGGYNDRRCEAHQEDR